MRYVDCFVAAVPTANRDAYVAHGQRFAAIFREMGALRVVECWGDDIPDGVHTSFPMAVGKTDDETVVVSWIERPDKATRDAMMAKMETDSRFHDAGAAMPFDGKRMIFGGFTPILDEGES